MKVARFQATLAIPLLFLVAGCAQFPLNTSRPLPTAGNFYNLALSPERVFEYRYVAANGLVFDRDHMSARLRCEGGACELRTTERTESLEREGGASFLFTLLDLVRKPQVYYATYDSGTIQGKQDFAGGGSTDASFAIPSRAHRLLRITVVWQMYLDPKHVLQQEVLTWDVPHPA